MAGDGEEAVGVNLQQAPTWTVAVVCTVFISISFLLERFLHKLTKRWRGKEDKEYKQKVLEKIKDELMLLGFISLILTALQSPVSRICMPVSWTKHMLPCKLGHTSFKSSQSPSSSGETSHRRKLFQFSGSLQRRILSGGSSTHCVDQGKAPFLSSESIHQLHIFIFVLAVVHVFISFVTMALGRYKIHRWTIWESEIKCAEKESATKTDGGIKFTKDDNFVNKHAHQFWSEKPILRWVVCFYRQFFSSVVKDDYIYMRRGFINMHLSGNNSYDFHKYILRSLEDDFKKVVGISWPLWVYVVFFMLINIDGFHTYFWVSFIPLILLLIVGAKLQVVITEMAIEVSNKQSVVQGEVIIRPKDDLFWFHKPKLLLSLMHFILFQNAFEFAFFFWVWTTFGFYSCYFENLPYIIVRLSFGVFVQVFFSYVTLPLYALVTQMGSQYKAAVMTETVATAAKGWLERAKKKQEKASVNEGKKEVQLPKLGRGSSTDLLDKGP